MCEKIETFLANIGKDKYIHFTVCLILALFIFAGCRAFGLGMYSVIPAFTVPLIAGLVKELYDKNHGGYFDHGDVAADFFGCFVALCLMSLLII